MHACMRAHTHSSMRRSSSFSCCSTPTLLRPTGMRTTPRLWGFLGLPPCCKPCWKTCRDRLPLLLLPNPDKFKNDVRCIRFVATSEKERARPRCCCILYFWNQRVEITKGGANSTTLFCGNEANDLPSFVPQGLGWRLSPSRGVLFRALYPLAAPACFVTQFQVRGCWVVRVVFMWHLLWLCSSFILYAVVFWLAIDTFCTYFIRMAVTLSNTVHRARLACPNSQTRQR